MKQPLHLQYQDIISYSEFIIQERESRYLAGVTPVNFLKLE